MPSCFIFVINQTLNRRLDWKAALRFPQKPFFSRMSNTSFASAPDHRGGLPPNSLIFINIYALVPMLTKWQRLLVIKHTQSFIHDIKWKQTKQSPKLQLGWICKCNHNRIPTDYQTFLYINSFHIKYIWLKMHIPRDTLQWGFPVYEVYIADQ